MSNVMARLTLWVAALWCVSLTTIGFWVVPMLFAYLPTPTLAGGVAARLFLAQTWVSCVCGLLLLMISRRHQPQDASAVLQASLMYVLAGTLLALLSEFAVAPRIVAREDLRLWHSIGSAMFILQWLCALIVFWRLTGTVQRASESESNQV
jgi:hypothetical protein